MSSSRRTAAWLRCSRAAIVAVLAAATVAAMTTPADARRPAPTAPAPSPVVDVVPATDRAGALGADFATSTDRAVLTTGDGTGLHVLEADRSDGLQWRTAATLSEPALTTRRWIGHACVTGSGRYAVVVYAPQEFTNDAVESSRGAFAAVVDLTGGQVTKLPFTTSLAYYNPGCGADDTVVLTQEGDGEHVSGTRLTRLDAHAPLTTITTITVGAVLSSSVPSATGIVAADGPALVSVGIDGHLRGIVSAAGTPGNLVADSRGGVVFTDYVGDTARVRRTAAGTTTTLGRGSRTLVGTQRAVNGRVLLTGPWSTDATAPTVVRLPDVSRPESVSSEGGLAFRVEDARDHGGESPGGGVRPPGPDETDAVHISLRARATHRPLAFVVEPGALVTSAYRSGQAASPVLTPRTASGATPNVAGSPTSPVDTDRFCSIPRNDVAEQVYQPTSRQVEWAADQAVRGALTGSYSPPGSGLTPYNPQALSPLPSLTGGGAVPAQILLGVLAQESNLEQASPLAASGEFGNPLVGNFYGRALDSSTDDVWAVNFYVSDCGYGISQQTDGMRLAGHEKPGETAFPLAKQKAIALDYRANIAAGLRTLALKWNELAALHMTVNGGSTSAIESWYLALWDYNSGYHHLGDSDTDGTTYGLGWANNPANPHYPADRTAFLENTYDDAAHPERWPYQEKVIGWAGHPIESADGGAGYRAAYWNDVDSRVTAEPPTTIACTSANQCYPGQKFTPNDGGVIGEPPGPCGHQSPAKKYNLQCFWHDSITWKSCTQTCGNEQLRFDPGYAEQPNGTNYPPTCSADSAALSSKAVIVDDITQSQFGPRCTSRATTTSGFSLNFAPASDGQFWSKVDWHQLGGGFNGHLWFTHSRRATDVGGALKVTGKWTAPTSTTGWTRIKVYVPDHAAWTRQADYTITAGDGVARHRIVNQASHVRDDDGNWAPSAGEWRDLGVFKLSSGASVSLSNVTLDGGEDDVAFDALAFIPAAAPAVAMVAMGDSYSAGEGVEPYDANSDVTNLSGNGKDACHRSTNAYGRLVKAPGHTSTIAAESTNPTGATSFAFIACSGAETPSLTGAAVDSPPSADDAAGHTDWGSIDHHWGEVPQVDQGYLDENTTLVTLSIGGNDARFGDLLAGCLVTIADCSNSTYTLTRKSNGSLDPDTLTRYEQSVISTMLPAHLKAVYKAIHAKAPRAKIVVVGYPQLFLDDPARPCNGITVASQKMMNTFATSLTAAVKSSVTAVKGLGYDLVFVDPTPGFRAGPHFICDLSGSDIGAWLNGAIASSHSGSSGDGSEHPGAGSFHPRLDGQRYFAQIINAALAG